VPILLGRRPAFPCKRTDAKEMGGAPPWLALDSKSHGHSSEMRAGPIPSQAQRQRPPSLTYWQGSYGTVPRRAVSANLYRCLQGFTISAACWRTRLR
jgi:hypothetical protein